MALPARPARVAAALQAYYEWMPVREPETRRRLRERRQQRASIEGVEHGQTSCQL